MDEHPATNFPVSSFRDSIIKKLRPSPATTIILDNGNEGIKQKEERQNTEQVYNPNKPLGKKRWVPASHVVNSNKLFTRNKVTSLLTTQKKIPKNIILNIYSPRPTITIKETQDTNLQTAERERDSKASRKKLYIHQQHLKTCLIISYFRLCFPQKLELSRCGPTIGFIFQDPSRVELSSLLESPTYGIEHRLTGRSCWYINSESPHSNTTISFVEFTTIATN